MQAPFDQWVHAVCTLTIANGVVIRDLPALDAPQWRDAYELDLAPECAARAILARLERAALSA